MLNIDLINIVRPNTVLANFATQSKSTTSQPNYISDKLFLKKLHTINKLSNIPQNDVYIGIDFEFNSHKIALMQISFKISTPTYSNNEYYILYPPELDQNIICYLKKHILSNTNILKILHGSESIDIEYIVNDLYNYTYSADFETITSDLIDFFVSMIDTKFLCEYYNLTNSNKLMPYKNSCKIYNMLVNHNQISENVKHELEQNEIQMGNISTIDININNLSEHLIIYAIHDVVYLVDIFLTFKNMLIKHNPKNYFLLIDCIRFAFMERKNISIISDDIAILNMMNNYFFNLEINIESSIDNKNDSNKLKQLKTIFTMLEFSDILIRHFLYLNPHIRVIFNINYIKSIVFNLFKLVTYKFILNRFQVKINTKSIYLYNLNINYQNVINDLHILQLNFIIQLINNFDLFVNNLI